MKGVEIIDTERLLQGGNEFSVHVNGEFRAIAFRMTIGKIVARRERVPVIWPQNTFAISNEVLVQRDCLLSTTLKGDLSSKNVTSHQAVGMIRAQPTKLFIKQSAQLRDRQVLHRPIIQRFNMPQDQARRAGDTPFFKTDLGRLST